MEEVEKLKNLLRVWNLAFYHTCSSAVYKNIKSVAWDNRPFQPTKIYLLFAVRAEAEEREKIIANRFE